MKNYELEELKALEFEGARFEEEGDNRGGHGGARDDHVTIGPQANRDTNRGISSGMEERSKAAERMELREEAMVGPRRHELQPEQAHPT